MLLISTRKHSVYSNKQSIMHATLRSWNGLKCNLKTINTMLSMRERTLPDMYGVFQI